jgi:hypothetical protein
MNALCARDLYVGVFPLGFISSITKYFNVLQSVMTVAHELFQSVTLEWVGEGVAKMSHQRGGSGGMGVSSY